jgi:hypothetical protein
LPMRVMSSAACRRFAMSNLAVRARAADWMSVAAARLRCDRRRSRTRGGVSSGGDARGVARCGRCGQCARGTEGAHGDNAAHVCLHACGTPVAPPSEVVLNGALEVDVLVDLLHVHVAIGVVLRTADDADAQRVAATRARAVAQTVASGAAPGRGCERGRCERGRGSSVGMRTECVDGVPVAVWRSKASMRARRACSSANWRCASSV